MSYLFTKWLGDIVGYPQKTIIRDEGSYEMYWDLRGRGGPVSISSWQKERADIFLARLKSDGVRAPVVLDVGCGNGAVLSYLKTNMPGLTGIGIDLSEQILAPVKEAGFETIVRNCALPSERKFPECDYVILFEVIEHVADAEALVESAMRVARRGVCISVPNTGFFTYRLRLLFGKFPAQWARLPNEHLRFWTLSDMRWWLRALGWNGTVSTYQGVPFFKKAWPALFAAGMVVWISKKA